MLKKQTISVSSPAQTMRIMTLNLAHGRKDKAHQVLQSTEMIRGNLEDVATVIRRENPALVAMQEADGPCAWSGNFDHVQYLAYKSNYAYSLRGEHIKYVGHSYGTALLSQLPLFNTDSIRFDPSGATPRKGFVVATFKWPHPPYPQVDVISLHLDFALRNVRRRQVELLVNTVIRRHRPVIIMGDFNAQWRSSESTLNYLVHRLNLRVHRPGDTSLASYRSTKRRLDWIFVSRNIHFADYEVLPDVLSDHKSLAANLYLTGDDWNPRPI
jgi:endonuclease/exonuclease/phosphatase family metal-dependent hydrolase